MLKVLLADDEKWVRATIKSVLPLEKLDLDLAGEAANGMEAFELAVRLKPDILLTDIKMPGLNGIELIAKLAAFLPDLKTIIISGYDEFDYAKKALQLGAVDYLLKPVDENNVAAVLTRVKQIILEERDRREREKLFQMHYEMSQPLLREKFLNELIAQNSYSLTRINEKLNDFHISLSNHCLTVLIISINDYITKVKNTLPEHRQSLLVKFAALSDRVARKYLNGLAFLNNRVENELIIIFNPDPRHNPGYLRTVLANLRRINNRRFNVTFSAGVSSTLAGRHNLRRLYEEAGAALKYKMLYGHGSLIFYDEVRSLPATAVCFSKDIVNEIVLNLGLLNEHNLGTLVDHLFEQVARFRETTPDLIKTSIWRLIIDVLHILNDAAFPPGKMYEYGDASLYECFRKLETLPEIHTYLKNLFRLMIKEHLQKSRPDNQNVVAAAKNYIERHFSQEITLELIAGYVFVNPSYFSELFKKETGCNYIDYITGLRMSKAKELLRQTDLKIYQICEAVGYADSKYFCKLFKKTTGLTPSEYKTGSTD